MNTQELVNEFKKSLWAEFSISKKQFHWLYKVAIKEGTARFNGEDWEIITLPDYWVVKKLKSRYTVTRYRYIRLSGDAEMQFVSGADAMDLSRDRVAYTLIKERVTESFEEERPRLESELRMLRMSLDSGVKGKNRIFMGDTSRTDKLNRIEQLEVRLGIDLIKELK